MACVVALEATTEAAADLILLAIRPLLSTHTLLLDLSLYAFPLVDARNACEQTALHVAAENDLPSIASVLLSNCVDTAAVDNRGNNALHLAIKEGHLDVVRVLLTESHIDAEAFNHKGETYRLISDWSWTRTCGHPSRAKPAPHSRDLRQG